MRLTNKFPRSDAGVRHAYIPPPELPPERQAQQKAAKEVVETLARCGVSHKNVDAVFSSAKYIISEQKVLSEAEGESNAQ